MNKLQERQVYSKRVGRKEKERLTERSWDAGKEEKGFKFQR